MRGYSAVARYERRPIITTASNTSIVNTKTRITPPSTSRPFGWSRGRVAVLECLGWRERFVAIGIENVIAARLRIMFCHVSGIDLERCVDGVLRRDESSARVGI